MQQIQGTPFFPGCGRGVIRLGGRGAGSAEVAVVSHRELTTLTTRPAAVIVVDAAPLSHFMIRLLGLGMPAVLITGQQAALLKAGLEVIVDGMSGVIALSKLAGAEAQVPLPEAPQQGKPVLTRDGQAVVLGASVANLQGVTHAMGCGATRISLVRSEYLTPENGGAPDADFYTHALSVLCRAAHPLSVTVRLLDLAADKCPPWVGQISGLVGPLGLQGARLYSIEPVRSVFIAELDALARIAPDHEVSLLIPFLARIEEFYHWRDEIEQFLPLPMAIGAMVETPAAVLAIKDWLAVADFVAIGCNDLMQCLFAADRDLEQVSPLLDPYTPVMFRLFRQIAEEAGQEIDRIRLCGLFPQLSGVLPMLLGLGYRHFSIEPLLIPYLAQSVADCNIPEANGLGAAVCAAADTESVRRLLGLSGSSVWAMASDLG
ncbi:putative PEP-binding protein [Nitrosococcus wardiae]|uniref:Phosphoenolpyruvate-protein phosphotransferase n=1 Tax=Nitrosococcus wardiae TaxID=1814290 RepID=A0A4P7BY57_9GAMM|nr:putative PEP-binding protein [Nitrosococcus wardiae]QBQ55108.1 phosphoenolpyruvate-protein phosphotransferase [Nitrosococcus wardiae]